jgi:LmbE family N-acetylglucosaminyl deacetylase
MDAVYPYARDHLHFPEHLEKDGLQPHKVRELLMWGADEPDTIIDVSDTIETKVAALLKHDSQVGGLATDRDAGERVRSKPERAGVADR